MTFTVTQAKDNKGTMAAIRLDFADVADCLDNRYVNPENLESLQKRARHLGVGDIASWYGGLRSEAEAVALVADGWADGAVQAMGIAGELSNLVPPPKSVRRRVHWGESGTELSVDRALAGDWDRAWRSMPRTALAVPRVVSIGCAFGGNGNVSAAQMLWTGAQMIVATDLLETAGYAVELRGLIHWIPRPGATQAAYVDVTVKSSGQPLRPDAVAAVFSHAGVFRTFGFAIGAAMPWQWSSHLGSIRPIADLPARCAAAGIADSLDVVMPAAYSSKGAVQNLTNLLQTL